MKEYVGRHRRKHKHRRFAVCAMVGTWRMLTDSDSDNVAVLDGSMHEDAAQMMRMLMMIVANCALSCS